MRSSENVVPDFCLEDFHNAPLHESSAAKRKRERRRLDGGQETIESPASPGVKPDALSCGPQSCRLLAYWKNYWITSSTIYTAKEITSRTVASYQNHGSRAHESTSFPLLASATQRIFNRGKTRSQILPALLPVIPKLWSSGAPSLSQPEMRKRVAGSRPFLVSYA